MSVVMAVACAIMGVSGALGQYAEPEHSGERWVLDATAASATVSASISNADSKPLTLPTSSGRQRENAFDSQQPGANGVPLHGAIALPTSFEAVDHATVVELSTLRNWWNEDDADLHPLLPQQRTVADDEAYAQFSAFSRHNFRGGEQVTSFSVSDGETVETVAVAVSVPFVHASHGQWGEHSEAAETLDDLLGSVWRLKKQQPVFMACGRHSAACNSVSADYAILDPGEPNIVQEQPTDWLLGLNGLSAWALLAYVSIVTVLFVSTLLWLGFVLTRAVVRVLVQAILCATSPVREDVPVRLVECAQTDSFYEVVEVHCGSGQAIKPLLRT